MASLRGCIVALVAFVVLFSSVCFQMLPQIAWMRRCIFTLVAFGWRFSTVFFKCVLKLPGQKEIKSQWLAMPELKSFFVLMSSLRRCIVTLVEFGWQFSTVFSNVSSNHLAEQMQSHIGCICLTCLYCVFSNVASNCLHEKMLDFSPLYIFKCVLKLPGWEEIKSHWLYLFDLSLLCVFKCLLISPAFEDAKSHWIHFCLFPS